MAGVLALIDMDEVSIRQYLADAFEGVDIDVALPESGAPEVAWGDTFFIYDPDRSLEGTGRFPFATIVTKDYPDDRLADLNRPGVFRLNIGVSKPTFQSLIGSTEGHDFTALDRIMPHPVYGKMYWVCVLNPSAETFQRVRPLLAEAYELAVSRDQKRAASE